ncbi:MAG TPA: hypothetical protein VGR22_08825, partial [Thermomicrobiales bacterium]|nr:hypothetical protein [Thermomicrobiales bacterium]
IIDRTTGTVTFRRVTVISITADRPATLEAGIVVALVGLATAIGYRTDVTMAIAGALIGWGGLASAIWFIADRFMSTPTSREDFQPLVRTIGYATAPAMLNVIHFIWWLGPLAAGFGTLWAFAATAFAVRQTTRFGWLRVIALTVGGGIVVNVLGFMLAAIAGIAPQVW